MKINFNFDVMNIEPIRANCFVCLYEAFTDTLLKTGDGELCNEIFPISVQRIEDKMVGEGGLLVDVMLHDDYIKEFPKLELVRKDGTPLNNCAIYTILITPDGKKICYAQRYVAMYHGFEMLPLEYNNDFVRIRHTFNVMSRERIDDAQVIIAKFNESIKTKEE